MCRLAEKKKESRRSIWLSCVLFSSGMEPVHQEEATNLWKQEDIQAAMLHSQVNRWYFGRHYFRDKVFGLSDKLGMARREKVNLCIRNSGLSLRPEK